MSTLTLGIWPEARGREYALGSHSLRHHNTEQPTSTSIYTQACTLVGERGYPGGVQDEV